jgi:hypothetical protein
MRRSVELSGSALLFVFEAVSVVALVVFVGPAVWPPEDAAGVALLAAFVLVVSGLVAAMWRRRRVDGSYLSSGYDIADDPVGDPRTGCDGAMGESGSAAARRGGRG